MNRRICVGISSGGSYILTRLCSFLHDGTQSLPRARVPAASMRKKKSANLFVAYQLPGALQVVYIPTAHVYMVRYG
jgi:hypothetical protein